MKKVLVMGWCVALVALAACGDGVSQQDAAVDLNGRDGSFFDAGVGLFDAAPDAAPDAMPADCIDSSDCTDGLECTDDICNDQGTCENPIDTSNACSDGDACTTTDVCLEDGTCQGQVVTCDDANTCTDDACNPANGQCAFTIDTSNGCSDGSLCTTSDACQASGTCQGTAVTCADQNSCTDDACNPANGQCAFTIDTSNGCSDGDSCTIQDACQANGSCRGDDLVCDDSDVCTIDSCDSGAPSSASACMVDPVSNGLACDFFGQGCALVPGILDDVAPVMTMEFWLRPDNVAGTILDGQFAGVEGFLVTRTPDALATSAEGVLTYQEVGNGTPIALSSPNGQWHHYAFYRTGTIVHSWLDGVYQGQVTGYPAWSTVGQTNLYVGCRFNEATGGSSSNYLGDLDELHIAREALYDPGTSFAPTAQALPATGTVGLYHCNTTTLFDDSSAAANDGSAVSGGWALTTPAGLICPAP